MFRLIQLLSNARRKDELAGSIQKPRLHYLKYNNDMQIHLYATFRLIAGVKTIALDLPPGSTVQQAIQESVRKFPALRRHWLNEQGELHAHVHILLQGNDITTLPDGLQTPLAADAELDIFPPVAGGKA